MRARPVPAALAKRGIVAMTDNLPPGATLGAADLASEFVRAFRAELEARVLGLPATPRRARRPAQEAQP